MIVLNVSPFNKTESIKTSDLAHVNPATATKSKHRMPEVNNIPFNYSLWSLRRADHSFTGVLPTVVRRCV
jgi:hypothetical protein